MFHFVVDLNFLKQVCVDYFLLCRCYIKNAGNFLVLLSLPLMIITLPLYLVFLVLYGLFLILNFAQDSYVDVELSFFVKILLLLLKLILWIPSIAFIIFVYYPARFIGYIIMLLSIPCDKIKKHIELNSVEEADLEKWVL